MKRVLYLYGLALWKHHAVLQAILGADIQLLQHAGLAAICRSCLHSEFDHATSVNNPNKLDRQLLEQIKQHEAVAQAVITVGSFFPARFATLYSNEAALFGFMRTNHQAIEDFLESSQGHTEWAVKGYIKRTQAQDYLLAQELEQQNISAISVGQRYVKEKQIALQVERRLTQWLQTQAKQALAQLSEWVTDRMQRSLPAATQAEHDKECFGNWAFLLAEDQMHRFQSTLDHINLTHAPFGLFFVCTGPWALYSFSQHVVIKN